MWLLLYRLTTTVVVVVTAVIIVPNCCDSFQIGHHRPVDVVRTVIEAKNKRTTTTTLSLETKFTKKTAKLLPTNDKNNNRNNHLLLLSTSNNNMESISFHNVKAVIFDVDGTLADSGKLGFDATNVVLMKYKIQPITMEEYLFGCRYTTPIRLAYHCNISKDDDPIEFERMGKLLGAEFDSYYINLVSMETASFYPGILELIQNIPSNVAVGALTNAAGQYAHAVLKANAAFAAAIALDETNDATTVTTTTTTCLYQRFGSILGADEVPKPKPYPDGLYQICKELNVVPTNCVYIGDATSDGMAAKAAGMNSIGVTWGANTEQTLHSANVFDIICHTVTDLQSILPQK